jgi:polyisoprenoid-binding protein YceI
MAGTTRRHLNGAIIVAILSAFALGACGGDTPSSPPAGAQMATAATGATTTTTTTTVAATPSATAATGTGATTTTATTAPAAATSAPASPTAAATATGAAAGSAPPAAPASANAARYAIVQEASKATYRVNETFVGRGFSVAVGSTNTFSGDIFIDRQRPSASRIGTITVDISKLASDSSRRDLAIRGDWLESNTYPTATFVPKRLEGLPDTPYVEGQELTFKIVGDLTVRTTTKEVTFDAKGKLEGDTFRGTATTNFNMTDFGFEPPDIAGVLKAENGVQLELTIEARRAP